MVCKHIARVNRKGQFFTTWVHNVEQIENFGLIDEDVEETDATGDFLSDDSFEWWNCIPVLIFKLLCVVSSSSD